jgi:hypothetical protein
VRTHGVAIIVVAATALNGVAFGARVRSEPTYSKVEIDEKLGQLQGELGAANRQDLERKLADMQRLISDQEARIAGQAAAINARQTSSLPAWIAIAIAVGSAVVSLWAPARNAWNRRRKEQAAPSLPVELTEHNQKITAAIDRLGHPPLNPPEIDLVVEVGNWLDDLAAAMERHELNEEVVAESGLEGHAVAFWNALTASPAPELAALKDTWNNSLGRFASERGERREQLRQREPRQAANAELEIEGQRYLM